MVVIKKVEISHRTIIFTFLFIGAVLFLYQIRQILFLLFISVILMSALNPAVDKMEKFKVPRWLGIAFMYVLIITFFSIIIASIVPPLVVQTSNLISLIPSFAHTIKIGTIDASTITSQISQISEIPTNIAKFVGGVFSNILLVFTLAVMTFYLLLERKHLNHYLKALFGKEGEKKAANFVDQLELHLGSWVRGELVLMTAIGLLSYIGLTLLGVPYALPLAIVAGILEVIPTVGPIVSSIPAIAAGLTISPYIALAVAALYFIVQQLENGFLVPKIMEKATGVNPLISLIALMIGFNIGGPGGSILAIPLLLLIKVSLSEFLAKKFESEE